METGEHQGAGGQSASARMHGSWEDTSRGSNAESMKQKLTHAGETAKQKLAAAQKATAAKAHDARIGVERQIQTHPLKAVGIAFAAGAILGIALRRRR